MLGLLISFGLAYWGSAKKAVSGAVAVLWAVAFTIFRLKYSPAGTEESLIRIALVTPVLALVASAAGYWSRRFRGKSRRQRGIQERSRLPD